MHLGNGIICPITGIPMIAIMAGAGIYAVKKAKFDFDKTKILPIITSTIFIFALQMINFSIPQTTSSGHIIGGLLLCILLGKYMGFIAMAAILLVQSILFNDGSLIAYGCNLFNMGFLACFIVYPYIFKPIEKKNKYIAAILASIIYLQLASITTGLEILVSGSIKQQFLNFIALMQIIHLPIGIIEGVFTAGIIYLLNKTKIKNLSYFFATTSIILSTIIYKYASVKPDGLEWSLLKIPQETINSTNNLIYSLFITLQGKISTINPTILNILSIIVLSVAMYVICLILSNKTKVINAK